MKALVGTFNQEKALVGALSVIVQPVVEPMDRFTALTRNQAADILTIFYTTFTVVRALLVPASTLVSSSAILWSSALTLLTSTTLLSVWGDTEVTVLRVGIALTGAGQHEYDFNI